MTLWHKTLQARFTDFSPAQQIMMVCNELNRAQNHRKNESELTHARSVLAQAYLENSGQTSELQHMLLQLDCEAWKMLNTGLKCG